MPLVKVSIFGTKSWLVMELMALSTSRLSGLPLRWGRGRGRVSCALQGPQARETEAHRKETMVGWGGAEETGESAQWAQDSWCHDEDILKLDSGDGAHSRGCS